MFAKQAADLKRGDLIRTPQNGLERVTDIWVARNGFTALISAVKPDQHALVVLRSYELLEVVS